MCLYFTVYRKTELNFLLLDEHSVSLAEDEEEVLLRLLLFLDGGGQCEPLRHCSHFCR